ncbi:glutamate--cysteine ligase [Amphibacillus indicireducens]|uniref:Glutamate--cysteine ligase n=1 Tax=Amphibacillus indicireducens TaxID=1076330 RepID=A0ABP7VY30_9BACI
MKLTFNQLVDFFGKDQHYLHLMTGQWGIERETHRINHDGSLALTPNPKKFTSQEASQSITLDFAESQLEFFTEPKDKIEDVIDELDKIYHFTNENINGELMWPFSMPPQLPDEKDIPIASFDYLEDGLDKETYREGLAVRYGKKIQMISGIHYNYSFSDAFIDQLHQTFESELPKQEFIDQLYLRISRNILKYRWLFVYLFGASPVVDQSYRSVFAEKMQAHQSDWFRQTFTQEAIDQYAVSLRTSRFGYSTEIEDKYQISYNQLDEHIDDLREVLSIDNERYQKIGVEKDGKPIQLNTKELQSEAEFYAPIRFRQVQKSGETLLDALENRGIRYFELRLLDLDPFAKLAITKDQMRFTHLFILFCLFEENNQFSQEEQIIANNNHQLISLLGRQPGLKLLDDEENQVDLEVCAKAIFAKLTQIAYLIDRSDSENGYVQLVKQEESKLVNRSLLPSQQIVDDMKNAGESFVEFGTRLAKQYQQSDLKQCENA